MGGWVGGWGLCATTAAPLFLNVAELGSRVMKVAKSFLDEGSKMSFAVANKVQFAGVLEEFGLSTTSDTPLVTVRTAKGAKYAMTEKFS